MGNSSINPAAEGAKDEAPRPLTPAAQRALAEAEQRRAEADRRRAEHAEEVGRTGPDPARYGDWERNGIASDF